MLDRGAAGGQLDAALRHQLERLDQRLAAALEPAERALGARQLHAHPDLPLAVVGRQQPQRRLHQCAAAAGARGAVSAPASSSSAIAASSPAPADCSTWWARSAALAPRAGQRLGGARVRGQPPPAGHRS